MSDPIEETETLLVLIPLLGLSVGVIWLVIQLKNKDSDLRKWIAKQFSVGGAVDKAMGGTGTPGTENYVSASDNLARWNELLGLGGNDGSGDSGNGVTATYLSPTALPNPVNPTEMVSPSDAAASYSLAETGGLDLAGYGTVQDPSATMPDGGAVFSWLQSHGVF